MYSRNRVGQRMENFELTMEVAKIACYSGHAECVKDVEDYYAGEATIEGSSDFQVFIFCTMAKHSVDQWTIVDQVVAMWQEDRRVHSNSRNAIQGLACSEDPAIANR